MIDVQFNTHRDSSIFSSNQMRSVTTDRFGQCSTGAAVPRESCLSVVIRPSAVTLSRPLVGSSRNSSCGSVISSSATHRRFLQCSSRSDAQVTCVLFVVCMRATTEHVTRFRLAPDLTARRR